jgi:hypothetical protein
MGMWRCGPAETRSNTTKEMVKAEIMSDTNSSNFWSKQLNFNLKSFFRVARARRTLLPMGMCWCGACRNSYGTTKVGVTLLDQNNKKVKELCQKWKAFHQQGVSCVALTILNMSLIGSNGIKPTGDEIEWFTKLIWFVAILRILWCVVVSFMKCHFLSFLC